MNFPWYQLNLREQPQAVLGSQVLQFPHFISSVISLSFFLFKLEAIYAEKAKHELKAISIQQKTRWHAWSNDMCLVSMQDNGSQLLMTSQFTRKQNSPLLLVFLTHYCSQISALPYTCWLLVEVCWQHVFKTCSISVGL